MSEGAMGTPNVDIHVTAGPARGRSFAFEKPGHLIFGRALDAHISVPEDPYVSRRHFELRINPPTCLLRDLNSTNGVFVNGVHYGGTSTSQADPTTPRHVGEVLLDDGDEIVVRETRLTVSIRSAANQDPTTRMLMQPKDALPDREIALLLISIPPTAQTPSSQGKTLFSSLVGALLTQIKRHPSSQSLLFLKYLDKGLMMAFPDIEPAYDLAGSLPAVPAHSDEPLRMALHWGSARTRRNGDVFGREVYRVYRMAGIRLPDHSLTLAQHGYLLITAEGLAQLAAEHRRKFHAAGTFELEGFDEPCKLWFLASPRPA